jgi:hypothetical protein
VTRSHLTAYLSDDDGRSCRSGFELDERAGVAYPDGVQAEDGTIYVIYDRNRTTDQEILLATFTEDDIRQGSCVTAGCRRKVRVTGAASLAIGR